MTPSDVIDLNRPLAPGRFMPPVLVQEKAGLFKKGYASFSANTMCSRAPSDSNISDPSHPPLFPVVEEERVTSHRRSEHLLFLLGEISELKNHRSGLFSSLKRMIIGPSFTTSTLYPPCATVSYTPQPALPIPVPLEASPLSRTLTLATSTPYRDEVPQPNASEALGILVHQGLHLQLRMALEAACTTNGAIIGSPKTTEASTRPARLTPANHIFNSSTSLVTPAMKNLFVEAVSEEMTEADANSFPLTRVLSPLERAIAEARAAGYHLHKPVSLAPNPSSPVPSPGCSVETQHVLHGDGLRRLVLCKNASAYPTSGFNGKETDESSSSTSAPNAGLQDIDYGLCLKRIGRGVGDDWVHRIRVMPSTVNLNVRLWDSKRTEDDKIEVQLGKPLLRTSPLKRVLKSSIRRDSVELEQSCPIPRRLRSVHSKMKIHRRRVVFDIPAKEADQSTPSLPPVTRERRRDRVRNRVRAKRRDVSEGTSEALDKVRRWSDEWKRRARLMAMPKPDIEATRSEQAQEASALSTISMATVVDYRSRWPKLREHVMSHHGYLEEDTSDEEPMEYDDDEADIADGVCHTGCEPVFVSLPSPIATAPSPKLANDARLAVPVEEESQAKVPAAMDGLKHTRMPLFRVHSLKAFERQTKRP